MKKLKSRHPERSEGSNPKVRFFAALRMTTALFLLVSAGYAHAMDYDMPVGYMPLTVDDLNKSELKKRSNYQNDGLMVFGDFDGDKTEDIAQMFYTKDNLKVMVMARLSKNNPESKWVRVEEFETNKKKGYNFPLGVIISKAEPSTYNKVCSGFNGECYKSRGESPKAVIKHNSIAFSTVNSEWVMYWDEEKQKFLEGYSE